MLAEGGSFYEFLRRWSLDPNHPKTRIWSIAITLALAWVPLVMLAVWLGPSGAEIDPLLSRAEPHARMLVALGLLLFAEPVLDERVAMVVDSVVTDGVLRPSSAADWNAGLAALRRSRDTRAFDLLWLVLGYGALLLAYLDLLPDWLARWLLSTLHGVDWADATVAWWWYVLIAQPLLLVVLLRWVHRWVLWGVLLWRLARLDLELRAVHADRAGGLGFTTIPLDSLQLFVLASGVALASVWYDEIAAGRAALSMFAGDLLAFVVLCATMMLLPYLGFTAKLVRAREAGLIEYAALMRRYAIAFDQRWLAHSDRQGQELLGHPDVGALADLRTCSAGVEEMRSVVPSGADLRAILIAVALPFVVAALAQGPSAVQLLWNAAVRLIAP